jgi:hypothetical protein
MGLNHKIVRMETTDASSILLDREWWLITLSFAGDGSEEVLPPSFRPAAGATVIDQLIWDGARVDFALTQAARIHVLAEMPIDDSQRKKLIASAKRKGTRSFHKWLPEFAWAKGHGEEIIKGADRLKVWLVQIAGVRADGDWCWAGPRIKELLPEQLKKYLIGS